MVICIKQGHVVNYADRTGLGYIVASCLVFSSLCFILQCCAQKMHGLIIQTLF